MIKILTVFFIIINTAFPQIIETDSLENIRHILSNGAICETLAIFNCYNVLLFRPDSVFHFDIETGIKNRLMKSYSKTTKENKIEVDREYRRFLKIIWKNTKPQLVDPEFPKLISDFQTRGGRALVSTDLVRKGLGTRWAINTSLGELKNFGFDFSKPWKEIQTPAFAYFNDGIIPSSFINKTWLLDSYLEIHQYKPKKLVFIDYDYDNLEHTRRIFERRGMEFCGIHYEKALKLLKQLRPSKEVVKWQLLHLLLFSFWIPESDIKSLDP